MRVRIHRGAHEIGGSCVEVESDAGERLVLDIGRPLSAGRDDDVPLPPITGLDDADDSLLGVVISHAHQDHWGLADILHVDVPVYMGAATGRILREAEYWTGNGLTIEPAGFLRHREPFDLGPFTVTPYLNDHSAFDAYSLLVEADGARLFYTGDIRAHGHKGEIFEELLRKPPRDVDALLMEGTNISAAGASPTSGMPSEADVERACADTMRSTEGIVVVCSSAQNIDRMVTLYKATLRSDRDFVMDLYGASIAMATEHPRIPRPGSGWPRVRVFARQRERVHVKRTEQFWRVDDIKPARIYGEELAGEPGHWVVPGRWGVLPTLDRIGALEGATVLWSMWSGYLEEPSGQALQRWLAERSIPLVQHHTSGHAGVADLQRLASAIGPGALVPIHSFGAARYEELFDDVVIHPDGEWWAV